MSEAITLRPIRADDEALLRAVYASYRAPEMAAAAVDWTEAQRAAFLRMQFDAQHRAYQQEFSGADFLVIQAGERPIGRLYVDRREDEIRIIDIALLPGERTGIGTRLIKQIFAEGAQTGKPVRGQVEWWNPAIRLFQRIGFRITGHTGLHYQVEWTPPEPPRPPASSL